MRAALFAVAFVVGLALLAPLDRWILPRLQRPLAEAGAELRVEALRFALPLGLRATGVGVDTTDAGIAFDSVYVGIFRDIDASACGGRIRGNVARNSISLDLANVDPSRCVRFSKLALESPIDGSVSVSGLDLLRPVVQAATKARVDVSSDGGIFRGVIPKAGSGGEDLPLGEWEFSDLVLRASLEDGRLDVDEGHTNTSGVEWELLGADLPSGDARSGLRVDFRARQVEDTPRSRALIGLMPKGPVDGNGWHNFRVVGTLRAPRVVAVN
jgi:type II secretion system protein N